MTRPRDRAADWLGAAEARDRILAAMRTLDAERVPLLDALGRVLAEPVVSPIDLPRWDNSAMDGFAVRAEDVRGASADAPRRLRVVDDVPAGAVPSRPIGPGEAIRVMTGAPMPDGADGVVRVEHTDGGHGIGTAAASVEIRDDTDAGRNVRRRGEDVREGAEVLSAGHGMRPGEIAVAASVGQAELSVVRRPVVAVLASGDELVEVERFDEVLEGRRIVSSNSYGLAAQLADAGAVPRVLAIARDDPDDLRAKLEGARGCDALVTTAGVSVGERDFLIEVLEGMGTEVDFWRVRVRPGSALAFGRVGGLGGIPWFGLPGNPVSTLVGFELFVRPALLRMAGRRAVHHPTVRARLRSRIPGKPGTMRFPRVRLSPTEDGGWEAESTGSQGSGVATSMVAADALLAVPEDRGDVEAGEVLPAVVLGGGPERGEAGW